MVNIARTTPTISPTMSHSVIVLLPGQGWSFSHGSRIFFSAQKREEFTNGGATRGRRDRYLIHERKKDPAEVCQVLDVSWWPLPELNWGHEDFQSSALPSELKGHRSGAPIVADPGGGCQAAVRAVSWTTIVLQTLSCSPCLRRSKAAHRQPSSSVRSHRKYPSHRRNAFRESRG